MKNIDLNPGGLIGALACGGIALAVAILNADLKNPGRGPYKIFVPALIGGAFAGNFLWRLLLKNPEQGTRHPALGTPETDENDERRSPNGYR